MRRYQPFMKRPNLSFILALSLLVPAAWFSTGCVVVAVGAGAGAVAYIRGELAGQVDADVGDTLRAVNRALDSFKFAKVSEKSDALVAIVVARTAEDKKIEVKVERLTDKTTKVRIRVGLLGDEALSMQLWERIKAKL